jgi:hypothetical protein
MSVLAIPATSVPAERVFSSSGRTDTPARNRISPALMEALQVVKFNQRNDVLSFSGHFSFDPYELEHLLLEEMTEADVYQSVQDELNSI